MKEQIAIQHLLNETLMNLRIKNSNYSLRAFAKKLDISPSALSEILKGKRKVSKQLAERMTNRLHLSPMEKASVLDKFPEKMRRNSKGKPSNLENDAYLKMTGNQFAVISESIHLAILSLVKTENYQSDITWMSKRLSVSENEVRKALFRLLEMELIIFENGEFKRSSLPIRVEDDVLNLSVQKSHIEDMEIAKEKIINLDVKDRDFSSMTLPGDPALLSKAKMILRDAQLKIEELMEQGKQQEVYKVTTYLYPLTNVKN